MLVLLLLCAVLDLAFGACSYAYCAHQSFCGTRGQLTPELHLVALNTPSSNPVSVKFYSNSNGVPVILALSSYAATNFIVEVAPSSNVMIQGILVSSASPNTTVSTQPSASTANYSVSLLPYYPASEDYYIGGRYLFDSSLANSIHNLNVTLYVL